MTKIEGKKLFPHPFPAFAGTSFAAQASRESGEEESKASFPRPILSFPRRRESRKLVKIVILLVLPIILSSAGFSEKMKFIEDAEKGTLTVRDGRVDVLTYRFGDQLKKGVNPKQTRSCYIHPLYSLDGQVITDDFIKDHPHHHGLFWTWPVVRTRGRDTQTWHPANLRQYFDRWLKRTVQDDVTILSVKNVWKLSGEEVVAEEIVTIQILQEGSFGRAIDIELVIQAIGGPLELQGAPDQNKGYGGLCLRGAPMFKGAVLTTDMGLQKKDSTNVPFRWADLSTRECGVAIFVSPDHPGFPTTWLIRQSYAGILNPSWPGLKPAVLQPGEPITLRYRIYIHRDDVDSGHVRQAYQKYLSSHF